MRQEFIEFLRASSDRRKKKPPPPTRSAPQLATWVENNLPEGFTVFAFPEPIRKRLRTSNLCEALNKQIRRRTRVAAILECSPKVEP